MSQIGDLKWPVVSVPNGAASAKKDITKNIEWVSSFEKIVLLFDDDKVGRKATQEVAEILPIGKVHIGKLPFKDASECLVKGQGGLLAGIAFTNNPYRPDGILGGEDLWERISTTKEVLSEPYPWECLNNKLEGLRLGEIITFCAGSGIGKSQFTKEIVYQLISNNKKVGGIFLEEKVERTTLCLMGLHMNSPIHLNSIEKVDQNDLRTAFDVLSSDGRLFLYDSCGSSEVASIMSKIRYLKRHCGINYIILDHISYIVAGISEGDERRIIDNLMNSLRSLVQELDICLICVSHLKRPAGDKGHEDGARTSLAQLKGSTAIGQISDAVIGLERNQQGKHPNVTTMRVLKNRHNGQTGVAGTVKYSHDTGRLAEVDVTFADEDDNTEEDF